MPSILANRFDKYRKMGIKIDHEWIFIGILVVVIFFAVPDAINDYDKFDSIKIGKTTVGKIGDKVFTEWRGQGKLR